MRAQAGTAAVLADPDAYLESARAAMRIAARAGEPLFPPKAEPTVTSFFESLYLHRCLSDAAEGSIGYYRIVLRRWQAITGDPPLARITNDTLVLFRDFLVKARGRRPTNVWRRGPSRTTSAPFRRCFSRPGPQAIETVMPFDIISAVPWIRPPKVTMPAPKIIDPGRLRIVYQATASMDVPWADGIKPPAWWQTLLVVAYVTQLRRRTLFQLRMADIDWHNSRLAIPGERFKNGRGMLIHLPPFALAHLQRIRSDRELVFPWHNGYRQFFCWMHKLQDLAGIPRAEHFGLHAIRRTAATCLWAESPQAAQWALGHSSLGTTAQHYVNATGLVARAIDNLPNPFGLNDGPSEPANADVAGGPAK